MKFELFIPDASPKLLTVDEKTISNISAEGELQRLLQGSQRWLDTVDQYGHPYRIRADAVTHYSPVSERTGFRSAR